MNDNSNRPGDITLPVKRTTGETIEERLTANAYHNILPARYQHKDENGDVVETQEELFERIPKNVAVPDIVYKAEEMGLTVTVTPDQIQPRRNESSRQEVAEEVFGEGTSLDDDVEVELTEHNAWAFAYDTLVPELENDDLREHAESVYEMYYEQISNLKFTPNSPTWMGAGNEIQQLSACFVNSPKDDMTDIHETATEAALTFQSGGGVGYDFSSLRPYGDPVGSTGGISSGPITFMRTFDQVCGTIAQGGTRRGAQMGVMHVWHPDIIQFIHAKNKDVSLAHTLQLNDPDDFTHNSFAEALEEARDLIGEDGKVPKFLRNAVEGHLSNFNISVGITDDFMEALENDEMFTLKNPRTDEPHIATEETKELYSQFDLGEYVTVGEVLEIPAGEIWGRIVDGAYENGEPGVVYIERMNKTHSFDTEKHPEHQINATNPCGEQELEEYESCNLGHINLSTLVAEQDNGTNPDFRAFMEEKGVDPDELTEEEAQPYVEEFLEYAINWEDIDERITSGIRFLDNVITMSDFPVEKYNEKVMGNRKVGLGIMGLAQMFIQMGVKYGSPVANEITRQVMTYINHEGKQVSADLADERGVFDEWNKSKYANPTEYPDWFEHHTGLDPDEYEDGFEVRNHDVTTIAPTGTTSMVGNTSGGCEPLYNVAYYKNVSQDVQGDEMLVEFDDYFLRTLEANDIDVDAVKREAQELMENNEFNGAESLETVPDAISELFITTGELTAKEHAGVQCAAQDGVDASISKTTNAANDSTREDADEVFRYIYENGGKGVTYYRDGTRSKQVLTTRAQNTEFSDMDEDEAAEFIREKIEDVFGDVETFVGEQFDGRSVVESAELSAQGDVDVESVFDTQDGFITVRDRPDTLNGITNRIETGYGKVYVTVNVDSNGDPFELIANIGNSGGYTNSFTEALAKTVSIALRSGVDPNEIVTELRGTRSPKVAWHNSTKIQSIPDAIGYALQQVLDDTVDAGRSENVESDVSAVTTDDSTSDDGDDDSAGGDTNALIDSGEAPECPECNGMNLYYSEGCKTCEDCGWSEC